MESVCVISIDGPAGSGKSTVGRRLAARLGARYLDSGAIYRAATWKVVDAGASFEHVDGVAELLDGTEIELVDSGETLAVLVDGRDVSREIRTPEVTARVHYVASEPKLRAIVRKLQRAYAADALLVAEGRDMGSVVFPDAEVKFYLDAAPRARADRRLADLAAAGHEATHEEVLRDIEERDRRDSTRAADPLVRPTGAVVIDSTHMTVEEVVEEMVRHAARLGVEARK